MMLHRVMLAACVAALALAPSTQAFTSPAMLGLRSAPAAAARRVGTLRVGRSPLRAPRVAAGLRMQDAPPAAEAEVVEKFEFQAEVSRVMDIIINSLYSDKVGALLASRALCHHHSPSYPHTLRSVARSSLESLGLGCCLASSRPSPP